MSYRGLVTSDQPFTNVTPVSVESNDTFDTTNPQAISFRLGVGGAGEDGFNFSSPDDGGVCFDADRPVGVTATVGGSGMEITPPFNLETLGPCGGVSPKLTDNDAPSSCPGLPAYDKATERGVFIGCANGNWQVRVTGGGGSNVSFRGSVTSGSPFTSATGVLMEASDTVTVTTNPAAIDYILNVGGSGQDGINFSGGTDVCFGLDAPSGATVLVGSDRTPVSVPFDLATLGSCP
ncbi:MAG: hypothetical protein H0W33_11280 [Gammaproteobacteria bacterium]|nr:hypothetical protein [Gammaproteobacteria bacterium]